MHYLISYLEQFTPRWDMPAKYYTQFVQGHKSSRWQILDSNPAKSAMLLITNYDKDLPPTGLGASSSAVLCCMSVNDMLRRAHESQNLSTSLFTKTS